VNDIQQFGEINAVIYVHKSSDLREDALFQYYINQFKSILPKEYADNFIIVFT
jgi:hypothetical protein